MLRLKTFMIALTRLNHQEVILNCDLIKFIERTHDTVITLLNGEKLTVEEKPEEVLRRIGIYRQQQATGSSARPVTVWPRGSEVAERSR